MEKNFEDLLVYMKNNTSSDFNELLEKAKEENKKQTRCFLVLAILTDISIIYYLSHFITRSFFQLLFFICPILIADIMLYIFTSLIFSKNRKKYIASFKENVIQKLLCNFYDNVNYIPGKQMPENLYDTAKYNEYYNEYNSDDYMEAMLNNKYPIKMAEINTVNVQTHTDSDGHTTTTRTTVFHGLFFQIQMNKSINSNLLIRKNHSISKKMRLDMDSEEFEKIFDVSATNQIIGMQLLTHDIMELLVSFKDTIGITYDISIYDNILYLRFHTGAMFEFKSFKKGAFDEQMLKQYYNVLDFTCNLSKMLIDLIEKTEI